MAQLQTAADGISNAQAGVGKIAKALLTGQQAPDADRDQVKDGLVTASTALGSTNAYVSLPSSGVSMAGADIVFLSRTDPAVDSAVATASSAVQDTENAGLQVVSNCN